ncbi:site-specific DNA-methyltransferase [Denitratisoma oestradiolicum]|uniref:Methyltransferase n=2 Tax=Denitratisoma oestradiolicum TaxID=311182 RepID=A0A6S6YHL6_9PROT|nr:site-specific DNA-methyltransferase [Denitratisoma oestradiolicum]TWO81005.1 DNA modification methylase [Denitratisoma oestradiolicum]CAB1367214.1 Methyltransferase [Denitratisoma oestradiolicum]
MTVTPAMASRIEMWPLDRLKPYQRNARTHSDAQVAQIAASIVEFGFTAPLLVSEDGGILAGHGRLAAARKLHLDAVPVVVLDHLTATQRRAYILADNQLALQAGWDQELLAVELADLSAAGFDLALTGFSDEELADLLGDIEEAERADEAAPIGEPEDEDIPDVPATPVSRAGDIWQLGAHRLVCGDSTDPAVVAALMAGDQARLCFTSPPYGQQRNYTQGIADWDALMRGVFAHLPMADDGQVLVNLGLIHRDNEVIPYWDGWISWMRTQGWRRFGWYVWDQGPGMPGDWAGRLAPSFEFVFHFNRESRKPNKIVPCKHAGQELHLRADGSSTAMRGKDGEVGGWTHAGQPTQDYRIPDSVIRVMRHKGKIGRDIDHPAVFPVALPEHILLAYSDPGDVVFEPFGGSGTTILAAQKTNRVARAIELAPSYTDVAVKRFQQNHPDIPVTLRATGQTFAEVESERLENTDASLAR